MIDTFFEEKGLDMREEDQRKQVEKLLNEALGDIKAKQNVDLDKVNQIFSKLRGTERLPKLPPGIQQQLKTLSQLQQQKRLSEGGEANHAVDEAIRILAEDIGKKMIEFHNQPQPPPENPPELT